MTSKNAIQTLVGVALGGAVVVALVMSGPSSSPSLVLQASGTSQPQATATSTGNNGNTDPTTGCNSNGNCNGLPKDFGVTVGSVSGLYPGASTTIGVTYTNPNSFPIYVTTATSTAKLTQGGTPATGAFACQASYLVTGTYSVSGGLTVPKNGSTRTTLPIGLSSAAPDGCKGAAWQVTVTAQAVK